MLQIRIARWGNKLDRLSKYLLNKLYKYPIRIALLLSISMIAASSLVLSFELKIPMLEAFYKVFPLFLGEFSDIELATPLSRLTGLGGLVAGVAFIAILGARIVTWFVNLSLRGGRIVQKVNHKNHIIICGWNMQGKNIIKQLLSPDIAEKRPIVILAQMEKRPLEDERVDFISGDPTKEEDLKRAGIMKADTAIVLTEMWQNDKLDINPDAKAVLITLAIETLRPDVYTCVQLLNSEYKKHLERANVDEYICLDRLSGNLLVASALNHGLSGILGELLEFSSGSEFYKKLVPNALVGAKFREVAKSLHDAHMTVIAVETKISVPCLDAEGQPMFDKHGKPKECLKERLVINPQEYDYPGDYTIKSGDQLFLLSIDEPSEKEMRKLKLSPSMP